MNLHKAALKMELAQVWGKRIEDIETAAQRDVNKLEGMADALRQAAAALDAHRSYYQAQVDDGTLDGPQCKLAMDVISRCVGGLQNLLDKAALARQLKQGELTGVRRSIDVLEREYEREKVRVQQVGQLLEHDGRPDAAAEDIQRRRQAAREERGLAMPKKKKAKKKAAKKKATKKKAKKKAAA